MASQNDNSERRLVPRWRYWQRTVFTSEHGGGDPRAHQKLDLRSTSTEEAISNWRRSPTIVSAADAISTATAFGVSHLSKEAASFLLVNESHATPDVISLAKWINGEVSSPEIDGPILPIREEAKRIIHVSRTLLSQTPRNVSYRLDMSLAYTVLGEASKAWAEMSKALALYPDHRLVLRTAVRLLVHQGRVEEAYNIVRQHPRTPYDPWLVSLELSLSRILNRPVMFMRHARNLINELKNRPGFITELASATGMFEWQEGAHKRGRRLLQLSLIEATDNVIAQAQWASKEQDPLIKVPPTALKKLGTMEANCIRAMVEARWQDALAQASEWEIDEPFSSRPAVAGSFIASALLGDHDRAARFAEAGLLADSEDQLLRNNYVVALVRAGKIEKANTEFKKIQRPLQPGYPEYTFRATEGLLKFADGEIEVGRKLYMQATELASSRNKLSVLVHWLVTEACYSDTVADPEIEKVVNILKRNPDPIISAMATKALNCSKERQLRALTEQRTLGAPSTLPQIMLSQLTDKK
jgi:Flp pilus assembly protein TadD